MYFTDNSDYDETEQKSKLIDKLCSSSFVVQGYSWMFGGLLITSVLAFLLIQTGMFMTMVETSPLLPLALFVVQIILTFVMGHGLNSDMSVGTMKTMFVVYCMTMGIDLAPIAMMYGAGEIGIAFFITALYFGCLAIVGKTTKMDLSKVGTICIVGLFVLCVSQIIMLIAHVSFDTRIMSIISLVIFTGITAWDMQRMNQLAEGYTDEKLAIFMALSLYLDFINIFLDVLRLIASNRD